MLAREVRYFGHVNHGNRNKVRASQQKSGWNQRVIYRQHYNQNMGSVRLGLFGQILRCSHLPFLQIHFATGTAS